jgi:chemotaxis signal transduction protein
VEIQYVLVFLIGKTKLAIDPGLINEIFVLDHITKVPVAPLFMRWVGSWQGNIIPVIDLSPFVSEKLKVVVAKKKAISVQISGRETLFAIIVDNIENVIEVKTVETIQSEIPYYAENKVISKNQEAYWKVSPRKIGKMVISNIDS